MMFRTADVSQESSSMADNFAMWGWNENCVKEKFILGIQEKLRPKTFLENRSGSLNRVQTDQDRDYFNMIY